MYVFKTKEWVLVFTDAGKKQGRLGERNVWHITIIFPDAIADCSQVMGIPSLAYAAALVECYRKNKAARQGQL
jgi:hypothetical protein